MEDQMYEQLRAVLSRRFDLTANDLNETTTYAELGFDSMDFVTLAVELEKDGVELDDGELTLDHTLAESVKLLARLS
jgi:acyl carrier protein